MMFVTKIPNHILNKKIVIAISGIDGIGKGYFSKKANEILGIEEINMLTTREFRENDSKISISDDYFDLLLKENRLIGSHENDNGYKYAYNIQDLYNLNRISFLELNVALQDIKNIREKLGEIGINLIYLIGLVGDIEYCKNNIILRDPQISQPKIVKKINMGKKISKILNKYKNEDSVKLFYINIKNRDIVLKEFINFLHNLILDI